MRIAVLSETDQVESRVAATPDTIKKYKALGAEVVVQAGSRQEMSGLGAASARSSRRGKRAPRASMIRPSAWRVAKRAASARGPARARRVSSASVSLPASASPPASTSTVTRATTISTTAS